MAQKYLVQILDDLDGTELSADEAEEVRFGLDGRAYVIDLSTGNAASLRDTLARYVDAARRADLTTGTTTRTTARTARGKPASARRTDLDQVREWANANGHPVSSRGRVPGAILDAYDTTH